jgi:hypothetical protein
VVFFRPEPAPQAVGIPAGNARPHLVHPLDQRVAVPPQLSPGPPLTASAQQQDRPSQELASLTPLECPGSADERSLNPFRKLHRTKPPQAACRGSLYGTFIFRQVPKNRVSKRHGAENLALLRRLALSLLKQHPDKRSLACKRLLAALDPEFLAEVLRGDGISGKL